MRVVGKCALLLGVFCCAIGLYILSTFVAVKYNATLASTNEFYYWWAAFIWPSYLALTAVLIACSAIRIRIPPWARIGLYLAVLFLYPELWRVDYALGLWNRQTYFRSATLPVEGEGWTTVRLSVEVLQPVFFVAGVVIAEVFSVVRRRYRARQASVQLDRQTA